MKNTYMAKKLGAAFKKGYPATYTKSQTKPIFRKSRREQKKELMRLFYTTGLEMGQCMSILRRKYAKKKMKFLPKLS